MYWNRRSDGYSFDLGLVVLKKNIRNFYINDKKIFINFNDTVHLYVALYTWAVNCLQDVYRYML